MMRRILLVAAAAVLFTQSAFAQNAQPDKIRLPLGYNRAQALAQDPAAAAALGANLAAPGTPGAGATVRDSQFPASTTPSVFSPEGYPIGVTGITGPTGSISLSNPMVMTDGTVIAHQSCTSNWYKLTPSNTGSYDPAQGAVWTTMPTMINGHAPRFFSSAVLPDGRFIVMGGEYNYKSSDGTCPGVWTNLGSIYDPVANSWSSVTPPSGWSQIGDSQATVLANGTYMQGNCCDSGKKSALLNAQTLTWTSTGTGKFDSYDEEGWTLLPNGKVLTVDAYVGTGTCSTGTEAYDPATGAWSSAGNTPSILADCATANAQGGTRTYEMGPQQMMYNGKVLALGANTANAVHSAVYDTASATWSAGPDIPSLCGASFNQQCTYADAPSVLQPNGLVLTAASFGAFNAPVRYLEYNPTANTIADTGFNSSGVTSFQINFVILPTGQIMGVYTDNANIALWNPSGTYQSAWQPVVQSVPNCVSPSGSYVASGLQFNGLSEGASYGDDAMANTNFPLIRIKNNSTGHIAYARTFNHSSRSIAVNAASSTSFKVASATEAGASTLYVVANGIPSAGTAVNVSSSCSTSTVAHDFNADGKSDIVWRNTTGDNAIWFMNGASASVAGLLNVSTNWYIVGQRDFNGDGKTDLLWASTAGDVAIWLMNGSSILSVTSLGNVGANWGVAGTADFNGDGKGDILWRNTAGDNAIWFMNGATISSVAGLGNVTTNWGVAGTADFNGDGKGDILWRNTAGDNAIWFMSGSTISSVVGLGNVPVNWSVVGTADFNGSGTGDIVWRNTVGDNAIWFMNGASVLSVAGLGNVTTDWSVVSNGDYNGDGKGDFLWRNTAGDNAIWFMNGATATSVVGLGNVPTNWTIQNAAAN